jgi:hypothetical protein
MVAGRSSPVTTKGRQLLGATDVVTGMPQRIDKPHNTAQRCLLCWAAPSTARRSWWVDTPDGPGCCGSGLSPRASSSIGDTGSTPDLRALRGSTSRGLMSMIPTEGRRTSSDTGRQAASPRQAYRAGPCRSAGCATDRVRRCGQPEPVVRRSASRSGWLPSGTSGAQRPVGSKVLAYLPGGVGPASGQQPGFRPWSGRR